jgi:hypothetical protein
MFMGKEKVMGNRRKMRDIECVTVEYEGGSYEVWVGMEVEEVEEVFVVDRDVDISPVMDQGVMNWMLEKAVDEIGLMRSSPVFIDMGRREREIEGY